jgi:hypothetical protein
MQNSESIVIFPFYTTVQAVLFINKIKSEFLTAVKLCVIMRYTMEQLIKRGLCAIRITNR